MHNYKIALKCGIPVQVVWIIYALVENLCFSRRQHFSKYWKIKPKSTKSAGNLIIIEKIFSSKINRRIMYVHEESIVVYKFEGPEKVKQERGFAYLSEGGGLYIFRYNNLPPQGIKNEQSLTPLFTFQVEESPLRLQCFYCKKFFACRSTYENHKRTHTGEKPFQCNVCGRCFGHQGNLKQHLHIHRDVKPHVCDICGRGFTRSNRLRDHKRAHQYELYMRTNVPWTTTQK